MLKIKTLRDLEPELKYFITGFIILVLLGTSTGLVYLQSKTMLNPAGTTQHIRGDMAGESGTDFDMPAHYPKSAGDLLLTTHNHLLGFAFLFFILCGLFYFNSLIHGRLKQFFMIEPFISVLVTFSSIWGIRFIHPSFVYLTIPAAILTYLSIYVLCVILLFDLFKRQP